MRKAQIPAPMYAESRTQPMLALLSLFVIRHKKQLNALKIITNESLETGFDCQDDAHAVYKQFKEDLCKDAASKWYGQIDIRAYNALMTWKVH